jgi:hemin uptake protein HemP
MQRDTSAQHLAAATQGARPVAQGTPLRRIDSAALLGAAHEVEIEHRGLIYRLRRTSLGKLILTK